MKKKYTTNNDNRNPTKSGNTTNNYNRNSMNSRKILNKAKMAFTWYLIAKGLKDETIKRKNLELKRFLTYVDKTLKKDLSLFVLILKYPTGFISEANLFEEMR